MVYVDANRQSDAAVIKENIPNDLKTGNQCVCWRFEQRAGKLTKIPISPVSGGKAMTNNPATWGSFEQACAFMERNSNINGIGYVFNGNGIIGIDIDGCRDAVSGLLTPTAHDIVSTLGSYTEISQSRTGIHILCRGKLPSGKRRHGPVEMYETGRYFIMTGNILDGAYSVINDASEQLAAIHAKYMQESVEAATEESRSFENMSSDEELIRIAMNAKNGSKFKQLFEGDTSLYGNDDSAADLALCNELAFYSGRDAEQMDRIFRRSALFRTKWDENHGGITYGRRTINKAVLDCREVYQAGKGKLSSAENEGQPLPPGDEEDAALGVYFEKTPYIVRSCCLMRIKGSGDKREYITLSNFVPVPLEEITRDDGMSVEKLFTLTAYVRGGIKLPVVTIPAAKFNAMNWLAEVWGFAANCYPGSGTKDYLRHAITEAGGKHVKRRSIYTHTGWRKISGIWVYLYHGGAVGGDNVSVELEPGLVRYLLPAASPEADYKEAAGQSLELLSIAPLEIVMPLLALVYLSPLNEPLRKVGIEPSFILFLLGMSGSFKSTLAALFLSHFGTFSSKTLPGSFRDTPNSLERRGFLLKDILTVIDDYFPSTSRIEGQKMESTAQAITRAYGDRTGRTRMNADTSLKAGYIPRGNLIITGEDTPNIGQSGIARHLVLEVKRGEINQDRLTICQANAASLAMSMRGYLEWLQPQMETLPEKLNTMFVGYRNSAQSSGQHARMPEAVAWLQVGIQMAVNYFQDAGAMDSIQAYEMQLQAWNIFIGQAEKQSQRIEEDRPVRKFLDAVRDLLAAKTIYTVVDTASADVEFISPGFVGYRDDQFYYFLPDIIHKEVFKHYSTKGELFHISKKMLLKHLEAEGIIRTVDENGRRVRTPLKRTGSKINRMIWLKREALDDSVQEQVEQ